MKQNRGKIGYFIRAVLKVVSGPARFWECGSRCFVGRFALGLEEAAALYGRKYNMGISLQERVTRSVHAIRTAFKRFPTAETGSKYHAEEGDSTLSDTRGERLSGSVMDRRA